MKLLVPILYILFCTSLIAQQPCANNGSCQTAEEIIFVKKYMKENKMYGVK